MNNKDYDSKFCGSLPIQHINQVQSYGFLIITDSALNIIQVSENIEKFLNALAPTFIGKQIDDLFSSVHDSAFSTRINNENLIHFTADVRYNQSEAETHLFAVVHVKPTHVMIEFEPIEQINKRSFNDVYQRVRETSARIFQAPTLSEALRTAAQQLKLFSGFDKVMIYKFDKDWNGHVLAEEMEAGMESYMGNTFPASDIPKQARDLYLKNPFRLIPDREYIPAKLFPLINPITSGFIDLSDCNVRGVVKVHLEYLKNMGVTCSMSSRILKDGVLWGLIACHHREAKFVSYEDCSIFEMLSTQISAKISAVEMSDNLSEQSRLQALQTKLLNDFYSTSNIKQSIDKCYQSLLQLLNCDGMIYTYSGKTQTYGATPDGTHIFTLLIWLQTKNLSQPYVSDSLSNAYDDGEQMKQTASGIISFPVNPVKDEFIVLFRKEISKTINWGGNPNEAINFEADMKTYHPRHSFVVWKEKVQGVSAPFSDFELNFISDFHRILVEAKIRELQ